jgi:uncharacterized protein (DUF433 family)
MSVVANQVEIGCMISRTPGIKSGTPHIAGTGVTVRTIVRYYKLGMSPEEIAAEYPHLSLAQVYGAQRLGLWPLTTDFRPLATDLCPPLSLAREVFPCFTGQLFAYESLRFAPRITA